MARRFVAWLVALPLVAAGTLLSHCYGLAVVDPATHSAAHTHGSGAAASVTEIVLSFPFALACVALAGLALAARAGQAFAGAPGTSRLAAWPFGLMPVAGFLLYQELSSLTGTGSLDLAALTAPAFLLGLLLQVPFGIAVYAISRRLLRLADRVGLALAALRAARRPAASLHKIRPFLDARGPRLATLALSAAPRAPPPSVQIC
jgi:hypothetical protein